MQVLIAKDKAEIGRLAADLVMRAAAKHDVFRLGVATGSSPEGLYAQLRAAHKAGEFSLATARAWALDEYVGVPSEHPERYRNVLRAQLVGDDKTGLLDENLHTPDGLAADPQAAADAYEASLVEGVHLQILGIGADGHIGFNEPATSFGSPARVEVLTAQTRRDNARFFDGDIDQVPKLAITQGLGTIMRAKKIVLVANGEAKADAIYQLVEGAVSARWPATILQHHCDVTVIVDEAAAAKLELIDYYREIQQVTQCQS